MKKRGHKGTKGKLRTPAHVRARVLVRKLNNETHREIAAAEKISKNTVTRIMGHQETQMLIDSFRAAILGLVPDAIKVLGKLIREKEDRQAVLETLYGARVLIQRHEVEKVEEPVRTYDLTRAEFFIQHGRWPTEKEVLEFDKTLEVEPLVKGSLTE